MLVGTKFVPPTLSLLVSVWTPFSIISSTQFDDDRSIWLWISSKNIPKLWLNLLKCFNTNTLNDELSRESMRAMNCQSKRAISKVSLRIFISKMFDDILMQSTVHTLCLDRVLLLTPVFKTLNQFLIRLEWVLFQLIPSMIFFHQLSGNSKLIFFCKSHRFCLSDSSHDTYDPKWCHAFKYCRSISRPQPVQLFSKTFQAMSIP